jgi:hypothetical protein
MFLKRVYIKRAGGEIASEACYAAWRGFLHKAYSLDFFEWDDLSQRRLRLDRSTLVVGGTTAVHMALRQIGVQPPPPLNLPVELASYYGRRIWQTTLGAIRQEISAGRAAPVFIKPLAEAKAFAGCVVAGDKDLQLLHHLEDDFSLQAHEPVTFVTEWRYYVHRGKIIGLAHYRGDWSTFPSSAAVRKAVAEYATAPIAYALDFGVSADDRTLLIEANDASALGAYGLDATLYATMLEDRWLQLVGVERSG